MKMELEEFKKKVNGYNIDDDIKIELLEDLTDSFSDNAVKDEYKEKYFELREKYKNRFLNSEDVEDTSDTEVEDVTKKIVDIKEI